MECHFCGAHKEGLPFRCNYCGESFCGEHRLPENHACPRVGGPRRPGYAKVQRLSKASKEKSSPTFLRSNRSRFGIKYAGIFSRNERKHILAASAVVCLVGLTLSTYFWTPLGFAILVPGFLVSFVGHELAHKFLARRNGLWAEFRTNLYGMMLTAASIVFPSFKFLAPGQTNIQGSASRDVLGAISLIGPSVNMGLGALCIAISRLSQGFFAGIFLELALFNGWLAITNLIPFGSLDGKMVFSWDKTRWAISIAGSVAIIALSYYYFVIV